MQKLSLISVLLLFGYLRAVALGGFIDRGPTTGWADQGSGEYYDGLVCDLFPELEAGTHWEVQVQNNPENPGWYRFIPFSGEWPGVDIAGESDVYMIINASDPEKVYMCDTDKILHVNGWQYIFSQNVPENLEEGSIYGTLSNGVITFPANSFINYKCSPADSHDRTQQTTVNRTGLLKIVLPESSSISAINSEYTDINVQYFDMFGRRVTNPCHGVYIKKTSRGAERVLIH